MMPDTLQLREVLIHPRQRKEVPQEHLGALVESIQRFGLFHPIRLNRADRSLNTGFCRFSAMMLMGVTELVEGEHFRYADIHDELEAREMELEENVRRKNLEWWEEAAAISDLHELRKEKFGENWSVRKTAEMVGKSIGTVQNSITLSKEILKDPELRKIEKLSSALNRVTTKKLIEEKRDQIERRTRGLTPSIPAEIIHGDAYSLIKAEPDESFDAVVTNFPFGVELEFKSGEKPYHDEEEYITDLVRGVTYEAYRVLRPNSWMVGFFDVRKITYSNHTRKLVKMVKELCTKVHYHPETNDSVLSLISDIQYESTRAMGLTGWMEEAGFDYVTLMPCVWVKPNKSQGTLGDPKKGLIVAYEAFVFAAKGNAILMKQGRQNIFIHNTLNPSERIFSVQMSREICRDVLDLVVMGGAKILDPFAGVGSIGLAALDKQCSFKGYELDEERFKNGNMLLREHQFATPKEVA
jgi:ParB-like chromosome segregation protein Spo0J